MPLLDHFHPPLSINRHWQGFHSAWASGIALDLNERLLPPRYFAEPTIQLGGQVEIDIATFEEPPPADGGGGAATAVWAPPRPAISVPIDFAAGDVFEIRVVNDEEGPRLVAAIELVSPANKDRPGHRKAFLAKCAAYLQAGVSVVVVDIVTTRQASLHAELMRALVVDGKGTPEGSSGLSAVAYRTTAGDGGARLDVWAEPLEIGESLPTLPLWLNASLSLPLDLDRTYEGTCGALRIRR